jgi:hypothetical protein
MANALISAMGRHSVLPAPVRMPPLLRAAAGWSDRQSVLAGSGFLSFSRAVFAGWLLREPLVDVGTCGGPRFRRGKDDLQIQPFLRRQLGGRRLDGGQECGARPLLLGENDLLLSGRSRVRNHESFATISGGVERDGIRRARGRHEARHSGDARDAVGNCRRVRIDVKAAGLGPTLRLSPSFTYNKLRQRARSSAAP